MAGTISFGGIGSGMDTEGIVTGLVNASSGQLNTYKKRSSDDNSAVSQLSNISSLLSTLKTAVSALSTNSDVGSYSGTSSTSGIAISTNGTAQPASYQVEVKALAREQRNYSKEFDTSNTALGQTGTLSLQVGKGDPISIDVKPTDTLDDMVSKINASGARVSAAIFNDGSHYRLQIRGLDTGADNSITFNEIGTDFGLNDAGSKVQSAQDASLKIDGFTVTRPTNQIVGAIQGVTLAVTAETTTPATVAIQSDPNGLAKKMQSVVDAYNAVINKIHGVAGYGTTKGTETALQGDSSLRSITDRLSDTVLSRVTGAGTFDTAGAIGLSVTKDGLLSLDSSKLNSAISKDANSVANVLAGVSNGSSSASSTGGVMDLMSSLINNLTSANGSLTARSDSLTAQAKQYSDSAAKEQTRLDAYADSLRKQFTAMDSIVSSNNSDLGYLQKLYA